MSVKKLKFDKETKIIEVIEEEEKVSLKYVQNRINFIISILSFIVSVGALGISYSQMMINEKQVDISVRQFSLDKKPVFECHIEHEELYDDEAYWNHYNDWLYENDIKIFDEWQRQNFPEGNFPYIDRDNSRFFWDAYDANDITTLNELTNGAFIDLRKEYSDYLLSKDYIGYDQWKEARYIYKKDYITLRNTGEYISNAYLEIFTYIMYHIEIGDDISYEFVMDMDKKILSEFWAGTYFTNSVYDSENNAFYIEYIQDRQVYEDEYLDLEKFSDFMSDGGLADRIGLDIDAIIEMRTVYFSIKYLDSEQEEQTEWYRYDLNNNTLNYVEVYNLDFEVPDSISERLNDAYYEAYTLYVARILGYQNAQRRPFLTDKSFSYIESAKEKIVSDLKELVNEM